MISVVIPNYNDIRIKTAIFNILPSKAVKEILIVDGKSTNPELLEFYNNITDSRVKLLKYEDKGIFDAINFGVKKSEGEIIYLQGADDVISHVDVFGEADEFLFRNEDYHGYCMGCEFIDGGGVVTREWNPRSVTRSKILFGILPPHFSLFLKKEVYSRVGNFEVSSGGDLSLDSLWLIKMGITIKQLKIYSDNKYCLKMALGGLSTGSIGGVFRQNLRLLVLLKNRQWRPKTWLFLPFIKMISKLFQVNLCKKLFSNKS